MNNAIYIDEIWKQLSALDPNMLITVQSIKDALSEAPDVDVPCVSCKNCTYRTSIDEHLRCNYWQDSITDETYCDQGILRSEE